MSTQIDNCHVIEISQLITPRDVKEKLPATEAAKSTVFSSREKIRDILNGRDSRRLLVILGPCSIHDPDATYDYAERLKKTADSIQDQILIVMRTYFEKPRTTIGWKGLINDPQLDGSCNIGEGYQLARQILLTLNRMGMPCATEFLDPVTPQYLSDLISWAAVGARTTESQTHREMASGLSMPVGFKNGTDGGIQVAVNAMIASNQPQSFIGINIDGLTSIIKTNGNPDRHIVLRGGGGRTNYSSHDITRAIKKLEGQEIVRPIMVDCSHGNSEKDHTRQALVAQSVLMQHQKGQEAIMGLLLESNLNPGKQKWEKGKSLDYGMSITDACLGWPETETLLYELAEGVAKKPSTEPVISL